MKMRMNDYGSNAVYSFTPRVYCKLELITKTIKLYKDLFCTIVGDC